MLKHTHLMKKEAVIKDLEDQKGIRQIHTKK